MFAQRVGVSALRRVAAKSQPSVFFNQAVPKAVVASGLSTTQTRFAATTEKVSIADANALLAAQRKLRPVSPHLDIYRPEQTWFGASIWTRITGGGLAGVVYVYSAAYLVAPLLGWHLESASLAAAFGALPFAIKGGIKFLISWPFVFHFMNGIRHITYDLGMGFAKSQIKNYGWGIWGASLVGGLYVAFGL